MVLSNVVSGPLANRYGSPFALVAFGAVSAPGLFLLPLVEHPALVGLAAGLAGAILGYFAVAMTYAMHFIPQDIQGSVFGFVRTSCLTIGALAPLVVGVLGDAGRFDIAFFCLPFYRGSIAGSVRYFPRTYNDSLHDFPAVLPTKTTRLNQPATHCVQYLLATAVLILTKRIYSERIEYYIRTNCISIYFPYNIWEEVKNMS